MPYLDLLVDFGVTGKIAGLGLGSRPADWPPRLGEKFDDASWRPGHLVRQFGFVDAHFEDDSGEWLCHLIQISLDKANRYEDMIPSAISERYGQFPSRIPFGEIAAAITTAGGEVHHLPRVHEAALETYWSPTGKVMFWLISPYQADDYPAFRVGDLHSVSTDSRVDIRLDQWAGQA